MTAPTTRTGDVIGVYPFEALRTSLAEATKAIRNVDRTVVGDDAFAELIEDQDQLVARLAATGPASAGEAIFLLHILRDRMVQDFNIDQTAAADRDIVRGVTAYLSDTPASQDPDAALQSLWEDYLQNRVEWNKTEEDTTAYKRCGEESGAIARRISATPAQGIVGLAVKIMIAANEPYEHEAFANQEALDDKALLSARDDAVRLTGIGGAS